MAVKNNDLVVGFIGIGVMGKSMALNLLKGGYTLHVYSRTKEKAQELINKGCVWQATPTAIAAVADILITMIGTPKDVEEVYLGENGVLAKARQGNNSHRYDQSRARSWQNRFTIKLTISGYRLWMPRSPESI